MSYFTGVPSETPTQTQPVIPTELPAYTTYPNTPTNPVPSDTMFGFTGLTKRELIAIEAMKAIEQSNVATELNDVLTIKEVTERAVNLADALIEALNTKV